MTIDPLVSAALAAGSAFELLVVVKATVALTLGLLVVQALRRARASRRHVVLATMFGVLAALPLVSGLAPSLTLKVAIDAPARVMSPSFPMSPTAELGNDRPLAWPATLPVEAGRESTPWSGPSVIEVVRVGWCLGALLCLVPVLTTILRLRRLRAMSDEWLEGNARVSGLAQEARFRRQVIVRLHPAVAAPMTFGAVTPAILLPVDAPAWNDKDLERAMIHELEHVRRHDWLIQLLSRVVCACYWWHPLIWIAWRQLHLEADRACDDAVAARGEAGAFAHQLVSLAQRMSKRRSPMVPAMANRGGLSMRVAALLNPRQARGRSGAGWMWAAVAVALSCSAALSPLGVTATERLADVGADVWLTPQAASIASDVPARPVVARPATVAALPDARSAVPAVREAEPMQPAPGDVSSLRFERVTVTRAPVTGLSALSPSTLSPSGNVFIANGATIESLVLWAYGIGADSRTPVKARPWALMDDASVRGEPVMSERFDIRGKAPFESSEPPPGTLGVFNYMVQTLLAERFGLATHWESRQRPIYVLHTVGGGIQLGPGVRSTALDCEALSVETLARNTDQSTRFFRRTCGVSSTSIDSPFMPSRWVSDVSGGSTSMARFAEVLSTSLRAEVVDATGLRGRYDIELHFGPGSSAQSPNDALRDQLGLWLEEQKAPGDVLVIDKVGRPTLD